MLRDRGVNVEAEDHCGRTTLYWAFGARDHELVRLLYSKDARMDKPEAGGLE